MYIFKINIKNENFVNAFAYPKTENIKCTLLYHNNSLQLENFRLNKKVKIIGNDTMLPML